MADLCYPTDMKAKDLSMWTQEAERLLQLIQESEDEGKGCPKRLAEKYDHALDVIAKIKENNPCVSH